MPVVPEWKVTAGIQYRTQLPWEGLSALARFDYAYTDESVNGTNASVSLFGASTSTPQTQESYDIGSLYFSVESDDGWSAWLGVDNLWDERAITFIWPRFSDNRVFTVRPREISAGVYFTF